MSGNPLAPKQARSRESQGRLMAAAREILSANGIEGTTVPRVAARAGLSPGSVYRRFPNKDALMRAVILETLESIDAAAVAGLTPELAERLSLQAFVEATVRHRLVGQRKNARMLRAMLQFTLSHTNASFKKKTAELTARSLRRVANFLLLKRSAIGHPDPRKALPFALMLMGSMLQQIVVLDAGMVSSLLPRSDDELVEELTRALLSYLRAEDKPKGTR